MKIRLREMDVLNLFLVKDDIAIFFVRSYVECSRNEYFYIHIYFFPSWHKKKYETQTCRVESHLSLTIQLSLVPNLEIKF